MNNNSVTRIIKGYPLSILEKSDPIPHLCDSCELILRNPQQIEECGHRYCFNCLESILSNEQICPACTKEGETTSLTKDKIFPDKAKSKEMGLLQVYCEFKERGCKEEILFSELQDHIEKCDFATITCNDCSKSVQRSELKTHLNNECVERNVICDTCKQELKFKDKANHDETACPGKLLQCRHCGSLFKDDKLLTDHMRDQCLSSWCWTPDKLCPFGCTTKFTNEAEFMEHRVTAYRDHLDMLNVRNKNISQEVESRYGQGSLKDGGARSDEIGEDLKQFLEGYHEQIIPEIANEVQQLIDDKVAMDIEFQELSREMQTLITTSYDGTIIWPVDKLSTRIREAHDRKVIELYSPPFHTGRYGYKLCLVLLPNGVPNEDSWDNSLSVYLKVMDGHFDALLPFPFNEAFEISMITDKKQHLKKISYQNPTNFSHPQLSTAFGSSNFISLNDLKSVENVFIKCSVDYKIVPP